MVANVGAGPSPTAAHLAVHQGKLERMLDCACVSVPARCLNVCYANVCCVNAKRFHSCCNRPASRSGLTSASRTRHISSCIAVIARVQLAQAFPTQLLALALAHLMQHYKASRRRCQRATLAQLSNSSQLPSSWGQHGLSQLSLHCMVLRNYSQTLNQSTNAAATCTAPATDRDLTFNSLAVPSRAVTTDRMTWSSKRVARDHVTP
jgi:hypothetical protein